MKEYTFNDNGVCTNPDIVKSKVSFTLLTYWSIFTAYTGKGWVYGYSWQASDSGAFSPVYLEDKEVFETQRAAIDACARKLLKEKAILDKKGLKELIFDNRQLSLFGDD